MSCEDCKNMASVPQAVYEYNMEYYKRTSMWQMIIIIILIFALVGSNAGWLWYESQFEDMEVTQENTDGYNNYIGNDGDILNGEADD